MIEPSPSSSHRPVRDDVFRKEELCDEFSMLWRSGPGTPVEEFLRHVGATNVSDDDLSALLAIEVHYRRERGEPVDPAELAQRFPGRAIPADTSQVGCGAEASTITYFKAAESFARKLVDTPELPADSMSSLRGPRVETTTCGRRRFGRFTLISDQPLGRGAFGEVWKAHDPNLDRVVALKLLIAGDYSDEERQRFMREAKAAAQLRHSNIVQVFEGGLIDKRPYIVYEFIGGPNLKDYLKDLPKQNWLSVRDSAELLCKVALALHEAHQQGIVHRDLKPANIMVIGEGLGVSRHGLEMSQESQRATASLSLTSNFQALTPFLTDFGMARRDSDFVMTQAGTMLGTPAYMSPEQWAGQPANAKSDVYSLGVILYELLTGERPFRSDRDLHVLKEQVFRDDPPRPSKLNGQVSADLETICSKCLEKDAARRYQSAAALSADLRRWLTGHPIEARPVSHRERAWRWCHRNPAIASLSATVVLVLLAGMAASSYFAFQSAGRNRELLNETERVNQKALEATQNATRADTKADEARLRLYCAHMNLAQSNWEIPQVGLVLDSLEKTRPQPGETDLRGFEWNYWQRLCNSYRFNLKGHGATVTSVVFNADGKRLASASDDQTVKVWDATNGQETLTLKGHSGWVTSVAFSADGMRLASASWDQAVKVWDANSGQETLTLKGHTGWVSCVAYSTDGKRLASASGDQTVKVWDATNGQEIFTLKGHTNFVASVAFSADGKRLASASGDRTIKVWDAANGQEIFTLKGHTGEVRSVAFSADGKRLASAGQDNTVKVWDATNGQETLALKGHTDEVWSVAFSVDRERLASASHDQTIKVWDATNGRETLTLKGHTGEVRSVAFCPDGKRLASGSWDQTVKVWDFASGQKTLTLSGHSDEVTSVAFSVDGKRLVSASRDQTVKVWEAASGQEALTLKGHTGAVQNVAFSADGKRLASASDDKTAKLWDATNGQETLTLTGHGDRVTSVAFSADGKRLASASGDRTIKVWDATNGQEIFTLKGHTGEVRSVAFSADGKRLASASRDRTVKVWDATSGQEMLTLKGHTEWVTSVAFSADGKRLASASGDPVNPRKPGEVKIWNAMNGHEILTSKGHTSEIWSVAFSANGKRLASAGLDQMVKVWDATSGQETITLKGHAGGVTSVAFSADGKRLASASKDKTVKVWDARPWTPEPAG